MLVLISILSPLLPLLTGIKKRLTLLWLYPLTGLVFDVLVSTLKRTSHLNHKWAPNLFVLLEFLIISAIYGRKMFPGRRIFTVFVSGMAGFFLLHTVMQGLNKYNLFGASFFSVSYVIYSMAGLLFILRRQQETFLERSWFFWVNVSMLVYASGCVLIFLFKDYLLEKDKNAYIHLWYTLFQLLNISKNVLWTFALYHYKEKE